MKKEIKDRWLTALRSGEYNQTPGQLGIQQGENAAYCCLGVLCEIAVEDGIVSRDVRATGSVEYISGSERQRMTLPGAVQIWAGIDDSNPEINAEGFDVVIDGITKHFASLSELNDYAGWTFDQIADFIEKKL